jgi:hypothetical protein
MGTEMGTGAMGNGPVPKGHRPFECPISHTDRKLSEPRKMVSVKILP